MSRKISLSALLPFYLFIFGICFAVTVFGSRAITVMSEARLLNNRYCIVIDAGHGGEDGGAVSCTGVLESKINLEIAQKLNDLMQYLGYETRMIRSEDISIHTAGKTIAARKASDLKERVRIINSVDRALLVSIHQNHFPEGKYSGAQVFYASNPESEELAKLLQTMLISTVNRGSNRNAKRASGIFLMENIKCNGVLIECGFLSNSQEEVKLQSPDYQNKLCCVFASVISNYLDRETTD